MLKPKIPTKREKKSAAKISISDIYNGVFKSMGTNTEQDKPKLIRLIEEHIKFDEIIPSGFIASFYKDKGRKHIYHLESFIRALILQKLIGIPTDSLLITILNCCQELRGFCKFDNVPDASQFTRFRTKHPEVNVPKSDAPDKDKEIGDFTSLKPVLSDFFAAHPESNFKIFIGDSAFDSYDTYSMLKNDFHFSRACIPLNLRNSKSSDACFDASGTPICPIDGTPFNYLGKSGGKNRSMRFKWVCHKH